MESSLEQKEKEYKQHCFESTTITLLIDFTLKPKVETALVEFVEKLLKDPYVEKLRVFEHHLYEERIPKEAMESLWERLGELCLCAGIEFETGDAWEKDSDLFFCNGICPGKNRNFYRISPDGYVSICIWGNEKETAIHHLLYGIEESAREMAELCIRKDPFQDENCVDCENFFECFGGRYCDIERYGRKRACQMIAAQFENI